MGSLNCKDMNCTHQNSGARLPVLIVRLYTSAYIDVQKCLNVDENYEVKASGNGLL